jgi:hypothetical protein
LIGKNIASIGKKNITIPYEEYTKIDKELPVAILGFYCYYEKRSILLREPTYFKYGEY